MGVQIREHRFGLAKVSLNPAEVAANTTAEQTFTIPGLTTDMFVAVNKPDLDAGLGIVNARVSAADTLAISFVNATGSGVNPAAEDYLVFWLKPESAPPAYVNP